MEDDFCTVYGRIPTPVGDGDWIATNSGCDVPRGEVVGSIVTDDGTNIPCFNAQADNYQYTNYCGLTYACSVGLICASP